jgi:pimeloyl-ACP methyl ester carboxylesterase
MFMRDNSLLMDDKIKLAINEVGIGSSVDSYRPVVLHTNRGEISARFYHIPNLKHAVIFVGGSNGGYSSPAYDLYGSLADQLVSEGVSSLWIQYRDPEDMLEAIVDVMAGIMFLEQSGIEQIGLVGYGVGSSVVVQAAALAMQIKTVVCLSPQGDGIEHVTSMPEETSLLVVHGKNDLQQPYPISEYMYAKAHDPRKLVLLNGTGHMLNESSDTVQRILNSWLLKQLKEGKTID